MARHSPGTAFPATSEQRRVGSALVLPSHAAAVGVCSQGDLPAAATSSLPQALLLLNGHVGLSSGKFLSFPFAELFPKTTGACKEGTTSQCRHLVWIHCQGKKSQFSATRARSKHFYKPRNLREDCYQTSLSIFPL